MTLKKSLREKSPEPLDGFDDLWYSDLEARASRPARSQAKGESARMKSMEQQIVESKRLKWEKASRWYDKLQVRKPKKGSQSK